MEWKGEKSPLLSAHAGQKQKIWRDQIKENRSWGWMVPILKMRRFSCLWRLSGYHQKWVIWHKFYIGNRVVSNIKMSRNRQACSLRNEGVQAFIHRQDFIHCHSSSRCMASKLWSFSSINAPFFHVHHYINSLGRTCVDPRHLCI